MNGGFDNSSSQKSEVRMGLKWVNGDVLQRERLHVPLFTFGCVRLLSNINKELLLHTAVSHKLHLPSYSVTTKLLFNS